jgi:2-amino-4-hydroxy-6-hydroxymethyldihydropteridine diphosphokinase
MNISVLIGLGSNCEPREDYLHQAIAALRYCGALQRIRCSSIYETPALLPPDAPADWNMPYLNMVIEARTEEAAETLLRMTQAMEQSLGRQTRGHWGPREIDIDWLAYGEMPVALPHLILPHPHMLGREFVMVPLADLCPDWRHPNDLSQRTAAQYAEMFRASSAIRHWSTPIAEEK